LESFKKVKEDNMANYDFDIGVIGGGAGGLTVTAGAAAGLSNQPQYTLKGGTSWNIYTAPQG
jgi:hypothetical protein